MKGLNLFSIVVLTLTILLVPLVSMQKAEKTKPTQAGFVSMPETSQNNTSDGKEFVYNTYVRLYNIEKEASILSKNDILMICKEVFGIELDLSKYRDEDFEEVD